jgi:hypothetical protein
VATAALGSVDLAGKTSGASEGERWGVTGGARGDGWLRPYLLLLPVASVAPRCRRPTGARVCGHGRADTHGERKGNGPGGLGPGTVHLGLCTVAHLSPFLFLLSFSLFQFCLEIVRALLHFCKIWELTQIIQGNNVSHQKVVWIDLETI